MPKLLAVDDSPSVRQMIRVTLMGQGFDIIEASDGLEGLAKATAEVVDVIVTDLNMPRMNGLTLIRHLRAMPTHHGIPIVVLTTESEDFAAKEAKAAGATAWITKPFTAEKLLGVVLGLVR